MVVLVTCKNEEVPIKNGDARVLTTLYTAFLDAQGQLTPQSVSDLVEFRTRTLMVVLITCKNEEGPIKNEGARVLPTFSPL